MNLQLPRGKHGKKGKLEFGMDVYTLLYFKQITSKDLLRAQGTLLNVLWLPGWEGSLRENGSRYMYGRATVLSTWNYHKIVNRLGKCYLLSCVLLFATPWLQSSSLFCPCSSPGQNTGVGRHSLLQGIFPTQGLSPGLLHCRWILYCLSHQGTH